MKPALNSMYRLFCNAPGCIQKGIVGLINLFITCRLSLTKTPSFIIFFVTSRCNAHCSHCFYRSAVGAPEDEMGLDAIKKVAHSLRNSNTLLLTGGEPFLRDDVPELCKAFYRYGKTKKIRIATNGYFTDKVIAASLEILQEKVDLTMQVSLDAIGNAHDHLRGLAGLFERTSETILQLNSLKKQFPGLKVSVTATVSRANCGKIEEISRYVKEKFGLTLDLALVRELGVGIHGLDKASQSEIAILEDAYKLPGGNELEAILSRRFGSPGTKKYDIAGDFARLEKETELDVIFKAERPAYRCLAGKTDLVIYPDGKVSLCEMAKPFGTLRDFDYDVYRLLHTPEAAEAGKKLQDCFCMHPCHLISAMRHDARVLLEMKNAKIPRQAD